MPGTVTLMGSGELSPTMGKVHHAVMSKIAGPVRAAFLDTPAGFQLNVDEISGKAVSYFEKHLGLALSVASLKTLEADSPVQLENALRKLELGNYIFAGPGSPTYTIRNWQGTAVLETLARRLASGAHLVFASAAAIAVGRYALPVYEVYKVGEQPHWVDGLDLLGPYGLELAIVPHWNNMEGGTHDTRYCFMGEPRLRILEPLLPASARILGIDEYTACILDLDAREVRVMGAGQVTIRCQGCGLYYPAGACFSLDQMGELAELPQSRPPADNPQEASGEVGASGDVWPIGPDDEAEALAHLVDLIVWARSQLREARQWELADEIRDRLSGLGILLEDGPSETNWRKD
jgi:hypothetical protein